MSLWLWLLVGFGICLAVYAAFVVVLIAFGRRHDARALARFIPDCLVLVGRLIRDPKLPRRQKAPLAILLVYLALPLDLVPDFLPVVGQLDDVIVAAWALRQVVRNAGPDLVVAHWPGPTASLNVLLGVAGVPSAGPA